MSKKTNASILKGSINAYKTNCRVNIEDYIEDMQPLDKITHLVMMIAALQTEEATAGVDTGKLVAAMLRREVATSILYNFVQT